MIKPFYFLLISLLTGVASQLLLKKGMQGITFNLAGWKEMISISFIREVLSFILRCLSDPTIVLYIILAGVSALTWVITLSKIDLSLAFPITIGLMFALITIFSWFFFEEDVSALRLLGAAVVFVGVYMMVRG